MRRLAAALMISWGAFSAPAQASDDLSPSATALVPVDNATLAMMTGGTAVALQLAAAAEAGARAVDLSATSTLQASISRSSARSGALTTGDISLGGVSGAMGGMTSFQLSTGFNNIQQNSAALAFVF